MSGSDSGEEGASHKEDAAEAKAHSEVSGQTKIELEDLPQRGSPEQFLTAALKLRDGGTWKISDLNEEIEEYGRTNLSANVKYGELMGFIERVPDGICLTDQGYQLAFSHEQEEDLTNIFRRGLKNAEIYLTILATLDNNGNYDTLLNNTDILEIMRTELGLVEPEEITLKRCITILFETLEMADFGEKKDSSGDYPTRFSFGDSWTLESILGKLHAEHPQEDEENTGDNVSNQDNGENDELSPDDATSTSLSEDPDTLKDVDVMMNGSPINKKETDGSKSSSDKEQKETPDEPSISSSGEVASKTQKINIHIDMELNLNNIDSAELEKKLKFLDEIL